MPLGFDYFITLNNIFRLETDTNDLVAVEKKIEVPESQEESKSVSELLDVLTEIKDCKDTCLFEPNFHPCPWCSGKLLTV